jgi:putative ABC transport system ATP-binding protein
MPNPVVKIENVSLTYNQGKPTEFKALQDINLEIYPEEFIIFFGPSGSGKSTLLYLIAGLEVPSKGKVSVNGSADITHLSAEEMIAFHRSSVGMIFQAFYLVPSLTAKDNVLLPMVFAGEEPAKREEVAAKLLDRFGIKDFQNRTPSHLSGGQQQRVAIARALVNNPSLVLADEPVGNLDSKNAAIVLDLIADLKNKDKKTVILVTHDPSYLPKADRVFYIQDGKIVKVADQSKEHNGYDAFKEKPAGEAKQKPSDQDTILKKLAKRYPGLDENRLMAKLLVHESLVPYDIEVIDNTEIIISQFISKEIDEHKMYKLLDESSKGDSKGLGLYHPTTTKLIKSVMEITKEVKVIESVSSASGEKTITISTKSKEVAEFILEKSTVKLSPAQKKKFHEVIGYRLEEKINSEQFKQVLDLSLKDGGVGLNSRTAEHFAERIEVLIAKLMEDKK